MVLEPVSALLVIPDVAKNPRHRSRIRASTHLISRRTFGALNWCSYSVGVRFFLLETPSAVIARGAAAIVKP